MSKATEWRELKRSVELALGQIQVNLICKDGTAIYVHLHNPFVGNDGPLSIVLEQAEALRLAEWILEVFR